METKIVYIIGTGRSGTTLLDIILGNGEKLFSAGELNRFTKRNGIPHSPRDIGVQGFWNVVTAELLKLGYPAPELLFNQFQKFEYHKWFYNVWSNNILKSKDFASYSNFQKDLFKVIHAQLKIVGDKSIIIDSSKYPLRGYFLSSIFKKEIAFVYINRHPTEVVHSFQKKDVEQPAKNRGLAHLYLLVVNFICRLVLKKIKKNSNVATITFDNLIKDPIATLEEIENDIKIDLSIPKKRISVQEPLSVGSLFDGNRLRLKHSIIFKSEKESTDKKSNFFDSFMLPIHQILWYKKNKI